VQGKELAVELVMILLAVILLVVLPVAFLVLMVGGLVYSVFRAIRGEKKDARPADHA
jgi:PDZ domain-containing secreted protein